MTRLLRAFWNRCNKRSRLASSILCQMIGCKADIRKNTQSRSPRPIVISFRRLPSRHPRSGPAPCILARAFASLLLEHSRRSADRLLQPARGLATVTAHGLQRAATHEVDDFWWRVELADEPAGRTHGRFDSVTDLAAAERTALDPRDDQLADGEPHAAH